MPLIRAIGRFFGHRMRVSEPNADYARLETHSDLGGIYGSASGMIGAVIWLVVMVVAIPLILFLVLVGLVYEGVIRIDARRRLPAAAHWAISLTVASIAGVGIAMFLATNILPTLVL